MKKLLFMVFFAMLTFIAKADGVVQVPVRKSSIDIKATHGHIRHAPLKNWCPIVETDGNYIYISSVSIGSCINLSLNNDETNLTYNISSCVSSSIVSFEIPHEILEDASTITITIDGITYIGEF